MTSEYLKFLTDKTVKDVVIGTTTWNPADATAYRTWYSEDIQNRDTLLITVGDSWTWGDHLGAIDWNKCFDDPVRLEQIFGRKLADMLSADWVNLAEPGCSNYWMIEQLQDIVPLLKTHTYKRAIVVITLTEDLREATYTRRFDVNTPYNHFFNSTNTLKEFLIEVENFLFQNINDVAITLPNVEFYTSRAFTDSWNDHGQLDKTWCDVLQDHVQFADYTKPVPFVAQMAINPLTEKYLKDSYKSEFLDIMRRVESRWGFLGVSEYNLKGSTYHPNPDGHRLWAEYLFSQIK
jgi:hypothetical protein